LSTEDPMRADATIDLPGRSLVVLRAHVHEPDAPDTSVAASVAASAAATSEAEGDEVDDNDDDEDDDES
jgi:hypothetical protein